MTSLLKTLGICTLTVLSMLAADSCGQKEAPVIKMGENIDKTDTLGIESIAVRIDTLTFHTDSLYDITLFGISDDRMFGLTADNIIVIMNHDGDILSTSKRTGRGPGEFVNLGGIEYDPYNDEIVLLDLWNKVIRLDPDGNLKDEIKNGNTPTFGDVKVLDKDRYAVTGISNDTRDYSIRIMDRDFNQINSMLPIANDAQKSNSGIIAIETMRAFNSKVLYKPFGELTYYELDGTSYSPYLIVDCGKYTVPPEMYSFVGEHSDLQNNFQIQDEYIIGEYYFVQYLYEKGMAWFYDIFDITNGKRLSHYRYGLEEYEKGLDEGFIFRYGGQRYGIFPQYVKDNVMFWSRFNEDGTTTLFTIYL